MGEIEIPQYTYRCPVCNKRAEAFRRMADRHDAPRCCVPMQFVFTPTFVKVFQPYTTAAYDKEERKRLNIRTEAEHLAFLRRNAYEEAGNDRSMAPPCEEELAHIRAESKKAEEQAKFEWLDADDS